MGPQGIAGVVGAPGPMVSIGHLAEYVPLYNVNNLIPIFFSWSIDSIHLPVPGRRRPLPHVGAMQNKYCEKMPEFAEEQNKLR